MTVRSPLTDVAEVPEHLWRTRASIGDLNPTKSDAEVRDVGRAPDALNVSGRSARRWCRESKWAGSDDALGALAGDERPRESGGVNSRRGRTRVATGRLNPHAQCPLHGDRDRASLTNEVQRRAKRVRCNAGLGWPWSDLAATSAAVRAQGETRLGVTLLPRSSGIATRAGAGS